MLSWFESLVFSKHLHLNSGHFQSAPGLLSGWNSKFQTEFKLLSNALVMEDNSPYEPVYIRVHLRLTY